MRTAAGLTTSERERLDALERENRELRRARPIPIGVRGAPSANECRRSAHGGAPDAPYGIGRRGRRPEIHDNDGAGRIGVEAPDLVKRAFAATRPEEAMGRDLTYVATPKGFAYVAFVIDVYAGMIVGWRASTSLRTDLAFDALEQVLHARPNSDGLVHHGDFGTQGGFNRSSHHLRTEVLYGKATWVDGDADGAAGDAIAGETARAAGCGATLS
ncbi:MAG: DDE-type integrase/transposase/recombinase [Thermodesulfobacteriota bacterium]